MVSIAREPIKKLLGYAVRAEIDSRNVYTKLSSRVKNPLLKEKFQILAFEEKKHKDVLENLFDALYHGDKLQVSSFAGAFCGKTEKQNHYGYCTDRKQNQHDFSLLGHFFASMALLKILLN